MLTQTAEGQRLRIHLRHWLFEQGHQGGQLTEFAAAHQLDESDARALAESEAALSMIEIREVLSGEMLCVIAGPRSRDVEERLRRRSDRAGVRRELCQRVLEKIALVPTGETVTVGSLLTVAERTEFEGLLLERGELRGALDHLDQLGLVTILQKAAGVRHFQLASTVAGIECAEQCRGDIDQWAKEQRTLPTIGTQYNLPNAQIGNAAFDSRNVHQHTGHDHTRTCIAPVAELLALLANAMPHEQAARAEVADLADNLATRTQEVRALNEAQRATWLGRLTAHLNTAFSPALATVVVNLVMNAMGLSVSA